MGWAVNAVPNWWHTGYVPGTSALLVRTAGGFTWSAVTNSNNAGGTNDLDLDALMWDLVDGVKAWPTNDLF